MASAPVLPQNTPYCLRRCPMSDLHPASTTPEATHKPLDRKPANTMRCRLLRVPRPQAWTPQAAARVYHIVHTGYDVSAGGMPRRGPAHMLLVSGDTSVPGMPAAGRQCVPRRAGPCLGGRSPEHHGGPPGEDGPGGRTHRTAGCVKAAGIKTACCRVSCGVLERGTPPRT
jgi:hypothetical protein